jgi:Uma2 family endonuclease
MAIMFAMEVSIPLRESERAIRLPSGVLELTEEELFEFCRSNRELRIERSAKGDIIVMSPAGGYSGYQSGEAFSQLKIWARQDGRGVVFDSSTGFRLPNGAMRSPDATWVELSRLKNLSHQEKEQFIPLCPDFVIEVASPSDDVSGLREKMNEYVECGLHLGWLILPATTQVEVYTAEGVETLNSPVTITGDPVLPGFRLELASIWKPPF